MAPSGVARFTLGFVPDRSLDPTLDALFPTDPGAANANVLTGSVIGVSISPDHGSCGGTITQGWTISVIMDD